MVKLHFSLVFSLSTALHSHPLKTRNTSNTIILKPVIEEGIGLFIMNVYTKELK